MSVFRIDCGYQNYDWGKVGSSSAVAQYASASNKATKIDESKPYAELWMGTHPSVPSVDVESKETLRDLVGASPEKFLHQSIIEKFGSSKELPFLFKVLSIEKVLSIQAHPDKKLAAQLHSADPKNYPDDNHKPEMAIAVTDFEGFCGFKPLEELKITLQSVPELNQLVGSALVEEFANGIKIGAATGSTEDLNNKKLIQRVFSKVMNASPEVIAAEAAKLVERSVAEPAIFTKISPQLPELIQRLNKQFPNDIGLFCGCLLLNHVCLKSGEAIFLQANMPHAYISGDIIECMAASDNVVRAGFTPKFKDVKNLVDMLTYTYDSPEKQKMAIESCSKAHGEAKLSVLYDPPIAEFSVLQTIFDKLNLIQYHDSFNGPSILICTKGAGSIKFNDVSKEIETGFVYFIAPGQPIELESSSDDFTTYRAFVEA